MHIDKETTAAAITWKLQGSLDVFAIGYLRAAFASAGAPDVLVIDLTEVGTIEPVAIGVLRQGLREQTAKGTRVALCGGSKDVRRLLHLVGIARNFPMLSTAAESAADDAEVCAIIPPASIPPRPREPDATRPSPAPASRSGSRPAMPSVRGLARLFVRRRVESGTAAAVINLGQRDGAEPERAQLESGQPA